MRKTPRHRNVSPESSGKRVLRLAQESIRALTPNELPLAVGGSDSCPTGSWPSTIDPGI